MCNADLPCIVPDLKVVGYGQVFDRTICFLHLTSKILENIRSEGRLNDFPAEIDACSFHVLFLSKT